MPVIVTNLTRGYDGLSYKPLKLLDDYNDTLPLTFTPPATIFDAASSKLPEAIRIVRNVGTADVTLTIQSEAGDAIPCPLKAGESHSFCTILAISGIPDDTSIVGYR